MSMHSRQAVLQAMCNEQGRQAFESHAMQPDSHSKWRY